MLRGFSVAAALLLSCLEHTRIWQETKVKRGSLDLLAHHSIPKVVLLGGCTLNVPKEEDYSQLVSVRTMLFEDWKGDLPFSCEVVMFTAAPDCPVRSNPTIMDSFISLPTDRDLRVIDGNGLAEALTLLQERKEEQFLKRFTATDGVGVSPGWPETIACS